MANNRPIRRPPTPRWKRGRRRPVRWLDANSTRASEGTCSINVLDAFCDPALPLKILLDGDADWDWADSSNVRIDRIVGTISWRSVRAASQTSPGAIAPFILRMGIIAVEDGTFETLDLWDPEVLEEYEWMWLYQGQGQTSWQFTDATNAVMHQHADIPVDIRTRRSLGKKDQVGLYAQVKYLSSVDGASGQSSLLPVIATELRTILRAG